LSCEYDLYDPSKGDYAEGMDLRDIFAVLEGLERVVVVCEYLEYAQNDQKIITTDERIAQEIACRALRKCIPDGKKMEVVPEEV
jgi:hypothetical protein